MKDLANAACLAVYYVSLYPMELKLFYTSRVKALSADIAILKQRNRFFVAAEIISFLAAIGCVVLFTLVNNGSWLLWMAAGCFFGYMIVRRFDVKNDQHIDQLERLRQTYHNEVCYQENDFSCFKTGNEYADTHHEYACDLDLFGVGSLFNRLNRTVSRGGSDRLAAELKSLSAETDHTKAEIELKRRSIDELAEMETFRMAFLSEGKSVADGIDTTHILQALTAAKHIRVPSFAAQTWTFILAWVSAIGVWTALCLAIFTPFDAGIAVWWSIINFFVVFIVCSKSLRAMSKCVGLLHNELKAYVRLIRLLANSTFREDLNRNICSDLKAAETSFNRLEKILDSLDRRSNVLGLMFTNALLLSDFFLVRKFLKWQHSYMEKIEYWIDCVSRMDANLSMATFKYNHPEAVPAEIVESNDVIYTAEGLYHPFLGQKAVRNNFIIEDGKYYIITGANMAGKSTFLRSVGVNYVLAMTGMPVFAEHLQVSCFQLFSSMRTNDDLTHGISYFNAELLRLEQLIAFCKSRRKTLIILDEILKGTNSLDKLNGSRLFLETVSRLSVSGIIATHDLELSKLEDAQGNRFINYCFEIELDNEVTYTYKIARGVAQNQNATFLLKNILQNI